MYLYELKLLALEKRLNRARRQLEWLNADLRRGSPHISPRAFKSRLAASKALIAALKEKGTPW